MSEQTDSPMTPSQRVQVFLDMVSAHAGSRPPAVMAAGNEVLAVVGGVELRLSDLQTLLGVAAGARSEKATGILPPDSDEPPTGDEIGALWDVDLGPDVNDALRGRYWFNDHGGTGLVRALRAGYALRDQSGE